MSDVVERLRANGGALAVAAAVEIEALEARVRELSFCLVLAIAKVDEETAREIADKLGSDAPKS